MTDPAAPLDTLPETRLMELVGQVLMTAAITLDANSTDEEVDAALESWPPDVPQAALSIAARSIFVLAQAVGMEADQIAACGMALVPTSAGEGGENT